MTIELVNPTLWTDITVIAGATLGNFARTMIPYWAKLRETPEMIFEKKFLGTAIISFLGATGIGIGLYPTLIQNVDINTMSLAGIFAITSLSAFGLNAAMNWGIDQVMTPEEITSKAEEIKQAEQKEEEEGTSTVKKDQKSSP